MPIENKESVVSIENLEVCSCNENENVISNTDNTSGNIIYNCIYENEAIKTSIDEVKDTDLELQTTKKNFSSRCKDSHHRSRFNRTSTWVQYQDGGLGYAYGGADPLNYDPTTKNRFIRFMFTLMLALYILTASVNLYSAKQALKAFYQEESCYLAVVPAAIILVSLNYFMACSACTRNTPFTHICLILSFFCACIVTGYFSGHYDTLLIVYSYVTLAFVAIACIILGVTSFDFTSLYLHPIALGVAIPFALTSFYLAYKKVVEHERDEYPLYILIVMVVGTLVHVLIMTAMLQIVLGSEAVEISEEDYTLGAFYLYTSIYDIFLKIIQIMGFCVRRGEEE